MAIGYFITGTDTGVGKTLVAAALIRRHGQRGARVVGMKPVASGCVLTPQGLRNEDALALMEHATVKVPYERVNPYAFEPPIAPHLAAAAVGVTIELPRIVAAYREVEERADVVIVEGAGGWRVPLGPETLLSDLPEQLGLKVILVVGLRLGCLNHALLTAEAIRHAGNATLVGWIGNHIDPGFTFAKENLATLRARLPAPCLGVIPGLTPVSVETAAAALNTPA